MERRSSYFTAFDLSLLSDYDQLEILTKLRRELKPKRIELYKRMKTIQAESRPNQYKTRSID